MSYSIELWVHFSSAFKAFLEQVRVIRVMKIYLRFFRVLLDHKAFCNATSFHLQSRYRANVSNVGEGHRLPTRHVDYLHTLRNRLALFESEVMYAGINFSI